MTRVHYAEAGAILRDTSRSSARLSWRAGSSQTFSSETSLFTISLQAGPFDQKEMPGGSAGIRGVPVGRYLGPIKLIGNIELRAMLLEFKLGNQKFTIGNDLFSTRVESGVTIPSPFAA